MTIEKLLTKYVPTRQAGQCWLWTGAITKGYATCRWKGKTYRAHRLAYEQWVGPIAEGLDLDHLCKTPRCVNPAHLEAVTHEENLRRARNYWRDRSCCSQGHPYTADNIRWGPKGHHRICRTCELESHRRQDNWQGGPWNRDKVHCPKGHPYDEANTHVNGQGARICKECNRERSRVNYHRMHPKVA